MQHSLINLIFIFVGVSKAVASQCLGGIFFSIFAGQPLIVVMTTAPITLYIKG
jgi:sodium borate transporter 11